MQKPFGLLRSLAIPLAGLAVASCKDVTTPSAASSGPAPSSGPSAALAPRVATNPTVSGAPSRSVGFREVGAIQIPVSARSAGALAALAGAAPGTLVRSFTAANPGFCGIQTGIAFDGTNLIMSCYSNNKLDLLSSTDGHLIKTLTVQGLSSFGALAWDAKQNRLFACHNFNTIYMIDTSDPNGDGIITPAEYQLKFNGGGCFDGLAFDGADDTLWMSNDASYPIYHYQQNGVLIASFSTNVTGGCGNSGIAAGGGNLYLANNGCSAIYVAGKPPTSSTLFATFPRRIEDLECDDVTFRTSGIAAIWQQDAYDRDIQAYAIAPGACPFGGSAVPQVVMDVQPNKISLSSTPVVNVVLISNGLFDATTINLANTVFVVNGNTASAAHIAMRGASYITSTADYNHDGLVDRLVVFNTAALQAAGLTAGATNIAVQDVTSATKKFQAADTVLPTFLP